MAPNDNKNTGTKIMREWLGVSITLASLIAGVIGSYAVLRSKVNNHEARVVALESKAIENYSNIAVLKNDITYIKDGIAEIRKAVKQ